MAEKKEYKIRALIPEDESTLEKALMEQGISLKRYQSLRTLSKQDEAIAGVEAGEDVLLFYSINHPENVLLPLESAVGSESPASAHSPSIVPREKRRPPHEEIMIVQMLKKRLEHELAKKGRHRLALIFLLPPESDLVNEVARSAHTLFKHAQEPEIHIPEIHTLIEKCLEDFGVTVAQVRGQAYETLGAQETSIDLSGREQVIDALHRGLQARKEGGSESPLLQRALVPAPSSAMVPSPNIVRTVLYRNAPGNDYSDEIVDGEFTESEPLFLKHPTPEQAVAMRNFQKRLEERRLALRLEDRDQVIEILVRYLTPLDLSRYSQPKKDFDKDALALFENNSPIHEIVPSSDWSTSRGLEESAQVLGIKSLLDLQTIARDGARQRRSSHYVPVTLHLGPGDGKIMEEFTSHESPGLARHVGIARSLLFNLSDLLDRSVCEGLSQEEAETLKQFNRRITLLLQHNFGRFGRLRINLSLPEDQARLKDYLVRLADNEEVVGYAKGNREALGTTGKYADDKPDLLSDNEIQCFAEYVQDPKAFFSKYYGAFFNPKSSQDMGALLDLKPRELLYGDFKDLSTHFGDRGQFITFAYSVKGFSHLEDYDYGVAFNEVATRLAPGGIMIDDGVVESYTWSHRIQPLREAQRNLGNDQYRIYLIGNDAGPVSMVCQRGIKGGKGETHFSYPAILGVCPGYKVVNLKNYEKVWPEAALRNKVTHHIKDRILHGLVRGIMDNTLRKECAQTWRQTCLKAIDPLFVTLFEEYIASWKSRRKNLSGSISRKDRLRLSSDKNMTEILNRFFDTQGITLDDFIQRLLLEQYAERRSTR